LGKKKPIKCAPAVRTALERGGNMRVIPLVEVEGFVKHTLKNKLQKDLRTLRILKEGDVECCAYYHLRKTLKPDPNWRVFARKYSPKTGYYTDLVIFHFKKARIAIEIKWSKENLSKKDRKALASARKNLRVKKTYFYSVMPDASSYEKLPAKRKAEKYRFFECVVDLGYPNQQKIAEFKQQRREYRV
jgi:hypothetical protein